MKVAHFISSPASGGVEVFVKDLAISLTKSHMEVVIVFLSNAKDMGRDIAFEELYLKELEENGVEYFFLGNECRKNILKGIYRLNRIIKNNNIKIFHSHMPYGVLFSLIKKIPLIYTHHSIKARLNKLTYAIFNLYVDQYVGISEVCSDSLRNSSGRDVITIRNCVDIKKFEGLTRVRKNKELLNVLMVGRINRDKDYLLMIEAVSQLPDVILNRVKVVVAGEGDPEYKNKIFSLVEQKKLRHKIAFIGNQNNIPALMFEADIFMMTSRTEGLPIALIESIVSGLPSIVTNVGGCPEIVNQYGCGISVEPNDSVKITDAIIKLVNSQDLLAEFSMNALANSNEFDVVVNSAKHMDLYLSIIK